MASSLVFQAIGFHSSKLQANQQQAMLRAVNVHQLASLGFILLAFSKKSSMNSLHFGLLSVATALFPGVIYYKNLVKDGQPVSLSRFVPTGGMLHMVFWVLLALRFKSFVGPK
eukprot:CAMPEP_0170491284 /NCGR_PEP_ID=MMETSP0208-20121228/10735_1 /TAXON_ID=197538 /ORGANISM="Strombidium inclinatum, Strain S3" /LENGTH=112 /DNA_ID=CAMNT_0010766833 /DNA_START=42 /DNA_END=380 /DNA_ORIENTATION=-